MTIRTHKMISGSGELDSGKMSLVNSSGPCCKHFWPCAEAAGTTLTDALNSLVITDANGVWTNSNRSFKFDSSSLGNLLSGAGSLADFADGDSWAVVMLSKYYDNSFLGDKHTVKLGNTTATFVTVGTEASSTTTVIRDDDATIFRQGVDGSSIAIADRSDLTVLDVTYCSGAEVISKLARGDVSYDSYDFAQTPVGAITLPNNFVQVGIELYGLAVFNFADGIPADFLVGLDWMHAQWLLGNKVIYPNWMTVA